MRKKYQLLCVVGIFTTLLFLGGCGTKKKVVTIMPCETETTDDSLYIRELGHGVSTNLQYARNKAVYDAQYKIVSRFCDSVRTYMPQVNYNSSNDSLYVGFKDTILFHYPLSYFGELSYTRKECEKFTFDANNQYHCFVTLALPKADIMHANDKITWDIIQYLANLSHQLRRDSTKSAIPSDIILNQ